jgi:hypothetical protein
VQKINYPTFKQAKKQAANQKHNSPHKQTRGSQKISHPEKKKH